MRHRKKTNPPGRRKIIDALSELMKKKDLLYEVLFLHFSSFNNDIKQKIAAQESSVERLETLIHASLASYSSNRVFARILLLEVRNSPSYFDSDAYRMVREYSGTLRAIIAEGIERGELKSDIDPSMLRKIILGSIEHACLGEIIFDRELDVDQTARSIIHTLLNGVENK